MIYKNLHMIDLLPINLDLNHYRLAYMYTNCTIYQESW